MPDVSIMVSAQDNFSATIHRMQQAVNPFERSLTGLQEVLDQLNANRVQLQVDATDANRALREAQHEYRNLARAAEEAQEAMENAATPEEQIAASQHLTEVNEALGRSQERVADAQAQYNQVRDNLSAVSREAQRTQRDMVNLSRTEEQNNRRNNDPNDPNAPNQPRSRWDVMREGINRMAEAGAVQLVGDAITDIADTFIASAYGNVGSNLFSGALGGAASGAAIGTAIAPGVGTAVGALAGGAIGLIQGGTQNYREKDEYFKGYVQESTENALAQQDEMLERGSEIASRRETDRISFNTLFQDKDIAGKFLEDLTRTAALTPFEYDDLTSMSKIIKTYGYDENHILPTLNIVGDTGAALGMGVDDMNAVSTSIGRMNATGKTTLEYISPLQERGVDAVGALAKHFKVSTGDVYDMISDGEIAGQEAARIILRAMADSFGGAMVDQSQTMGGLQSTLEDANAELANAMGVGYNTARKEGLQAEIDFLSGETGQQMQEAYSMIGQWKAELANSKEEMQRDIMNAVMSGDSLSMDYGSSQEDVEAAVQSMQQQYADAMANGGEAAGAEAGQVLARAQTLAISVYNASEGAQIALESELALAGQIRDDTASNSAFYNAGLMKGQQYSKGIAAGMKFTLSPDAASPAPAFTAAPTNATQNGSYLPGRGYAYGLDRVPHDDYPALLHEGERVLTANQARQMDAGNSGAAPISITVQNMQIREEADIGRVAEALYEQIRIAQATRKP